MTINNKHIVLLLLGVCSMLSGVNGQPGFAWKAAIDPVPHNGFYRIALPPALLAKCYYEGTVPKDLRLFTEEGRGVTYVFQPDHVPLQDDNFENLPLMATSIDDKSRLSVVVENTTGELRARLVLVIRNTDVCQQVTISGSDDNKQWFVIRDHISLNCHFKSTDGQFLQDIDIAPSRYRYFKITTGSKDQLPVNIRKVGVWKKQPVRMPVVQQLQATAIQQKDSTDGISYISAVFPEPTLLDQLRIGITGTKFYKREFTMRVRKNGSWQVLGPMMLQTGKEPVYPVGLVADTVLFEIYNQDNPPLKVDSIYAGMITRYLLAYLDSGTRYELQWGNPLAVLPRYDLDSFLDSIGTNIGTAILQPSVAKPALPAEEWRGRKKENRLFIWLALAAALLILLFLTFKMTRKVGTASGDELEHE